MRLAVDPRDGAVRLTLPPRAALRPALAFAEAHRDWIEAALARLAAPRPFRPGGTVPLEGVERTIAWDVVHPRAIACDRDAIRIGGPAELLATRLTRWLKARALATLTAETRDCAVRAGVQVGRTSIGDARGRWGSCTAGGDIRYSWRLILAPPEVRRATVAHEVAHRLHMDHSPAFHAAVARLYGREPEAERAWLRRHGAGLHWIGREGPGAP